jgi:hypothetical protein
MGPSRYCVPPSDVHKVLLPPPLANSVRAPFSDRRMTSKHKEYTPHPLVTDSTVANRSSCENASEISRFDRRKPPPGGGFLQTGVGGGNLCNSVKRSNEEIRGTNWFRFFFRACCAKIVGNHPLGGGFGLGCGGGNLELRFRTGVRRGKP